MFKKILLLLIMFSLTGCYDHKELNEIAILTASEINKKDGEYTVTAQVVNPQSKDTIIVQAPFIIYKGTGQTLQEAYRQIKLQSSRYLYPNHLQLLIINEELAKEDINQVIDFFLRAPHIRTEFNIIIGKNEDILNITTPIDDNSSTSIVDTMKTNTKYLGSTNLVTFNEFANMSIDKKLEIILPSVESINNNKEAETTKNTESTETESMYKLSNLAVFKDSKLLGYLTQDESITYNILKNKADTTLITYECEKGKYMTTEMTEIKSDISTKNKEIDIKIKMTGNVNEIMCDISLSKEKNIKKLEKELEEYTTKEIKKNINNIRKTYNSDIFGFLELIYKTDYNTYKEIKDTYYKETYQKMKINVSTSIDIIGKGNIVEGHNEEN